MDDSKHQRLQRACWPHNTGLQFLLNISLGAKTLEIITSLLLSAREYQQSSMEGIILEPMYLYSRRSRARRLPFTTWFTTFYSEYGAWSGFLS